MSQMLLLGTVANAPQDYKFIGDIANHNMLLKIREKVREIDNTTNNDFLAMWKEIYYLLTKIILHYQEKQQVDIKYMIPKQMFEMYKNINYLSTKDPFCWLQSCIQDQSEAFYEHLKFNANEIKKSIRSHPSHVKAPFLAKVRA